MSGVYLGSTLLKVYMELLENRFNVIIDGQFGSTGKGLFGAYLSVNNHADIFVSNLSPNAGHTYALYDGTKVVTKQLPVGAVINKRSTIYLTAGSIIDIDKLLEEIEKFEIDYTRLFIHPNATIIKEKDKLLEEDFNSSIFCIASTKTGTGSALSRKILREAIIARDVPELKDYVKELDLMNLMDMGCTVLMETSQGLDLSLNHGVSYPYCTSRDITVSSALSDAGVHPKYLGYTSMALRTYPIRVGNDYNTKGERITYSGPFYEDSREISWEELGEEPERTTVTGKIRRVATFSETQYRRGLYLLRPDFIFLNFANYIKTKKEIENFMEIFDNTERIPTHLGFGPTIKDVYRVNDSYELYGTIMENIN